MEDWKQLEGETVKEVKAPDRAETMAEIELVCESGKRFYVFSGAWAESPAELHKVLV